MIAAPPHFGDELQDYVDKRLNANVRRAVEDHLNVCAECRRQIDALTWTKQAMRLIPKTRAPRHLREEISQEMRTERVEVELFSQRSHAWGSNLPIVIAIAVLVGLGAIVVNEYQSRPITVPAMVARDFQELRANELNLQLETTNPGVLSAYFEGFEVPFPVRIFDPQAIGATLVGGRALDPDGQIRILVLYRGTSGRLIACEMFNGSEAGLPAGATIRETGGVRFHIYREGGITSVFWREGSVVWSLASDLDSDQLVRMAASQAKT